MASNPQTDMTPMHSPRNQTSKYAFLGLLILLAGGVLYFIHSFLNSVVAGLLAAVVLYPLHLKIDRGFRIFSRFFRDSRAGRLFMRIRFRDTPQGWEQRLKRKHTGLLGKLLWPLTRFHASMHRFLTISYLDDCKNSIRTRRCLAALVSTALLVILLALPTFFLIKTAVTEAKNTLDYAVQKLHQDDFRQSLSDFYQKESTREFLRKVQESPVGQSLLSHLESRMDSPDLLIALDKFMNSLIPDEIEKSLDENIAGIPPRKEKAPQTPAGTAGTAAPEPPAQQPGIPSIRNSRQESPEILTRLEQSFFQFSASFLKFSQYLIMKGVAGISGLFFNIFIMIVVVFFIFHQGSYLYHFFRRVGPFSEDDYLQITDKIRDVSSTVVLGVIGTACVQGIIAMIGYWVAGLPAFFLGILTAFCAIIPFVGTALIWVPAALFLLITGELKLAAFLVLWCFLLVTQIDGLIRPLLMSGGRAKLSYGVLFFAILGGLKTFGLIGLLYGPLLAGVFITCLDIFARKYKN